jgi:hypothetical protein
MRNAYTILIGKSVATILLKTPRRRDEENV